MANVTDAERKEIAEMCAELTREQVATMTHLARLMLLRQEVEVEITAIQEAIEDGCCPGAPTMH
jgi:hypothetical protein